MWIASKTYHVAFPYESLSKRVGVSFLCQNLKMSKLGNGWCDTGAPFNTAECKWDGGDCCNTSLALYDCQDPSSPNYLQVCAGGYLTLLRWMSYMHRVRTINTPFLSCTTLHAQSSATGLIFPAPINPLYSSTAAGRSVSTAGVAQSFNNYYEVRIRGMDIRGSGV